MDVENSFVSYAFLVDSQGRVRWKATGSANFEGLKLLYRSVDAILSGKSTASKENKNPIKKQRAPESRGKEKSVEE